MLLITGQRRKNWENSFGISSRFRFLIYKLQQKKRINRPKGQRLTRNEYAKIYREKHKEEIKIRKKIDYEKKKYRKYYEKNKEKMRANESIL